MTNDNCLAGVRCPECGNEDRFLINATATADVTDDGAELAYPSDFYWDESSLVRCPGCDKVGLLPDFMTGASDEPPVPVRGYPDIRTMTDQELEAHVARLYGNWMYHEAAERGYDHQAASAASNEHCEAKAELELRKCRKQAEPLTALTELLVSSFES